ncbi:MAG TPA: hypothetical protein VFE62_20420 [Gemmataceae bacterium]|nr:hypothetical protein [Gemmataceae bacterium]
MKAGHAAYVTTIEFSPHAQSLQRRFAAFARYLQNLTRKDYGSQNALKAMPNLVRLLFGLREDIRRFGLPVYSFDLEIQTINRSIIAGLDARLARQYAGFGAPRGTISWGEALLNCYLDLFVTFTVLKTPKEIGAKPAYLINPRTGKPRELEIDVVFEGFHLAFEFQGHPSHYSDPRTQATDAFKLASLPVLSRILIPVNVCQLQSTALQTLIANSMKDHVGLHDVLATGDPSRFKHGAASRQQLLRFSKAVQRLYLAQSIFRLALDWVDTKANAYLMKPMHAGTISATIPAPRHGTTNLDLDLPRIYANLRHVSKIRKT